MHLNMSTAMVKSQASRLELASVASSVVAEQKRRKPHPAQSLPKRMMHSPTVFPGEDAPGTGLRHFPEDLPEDSVDEESQLAFASNHLKQQKTGDFQYKTTKECYEEFPALVHSSFLTNPAVVEIDASDLMEGPQSGNRQRPAVVDEEDRQRPRFPGEKQTPDRYLRELSARRGNW